MNYTDKQLLDRVKSLPSFKGWPEEGVLDIWVRSSADKYDQFDDKVYSFNCEKGKEPKFALVTTGTTNAGSFGLKKFKTYNSKGCAVLKSDVIVYYSHAPGLHKGKTPAYVQVKPFPYYRDNDMDDKAEELGQEYYDIIGANCHPAGTFSTIIVNWSLACLVRNIKAKFDEWLKFMNKRKLSVCILKQF